MKRSILSFAVLISLVVGTLFATASIDGNLIILAKKKLTFTEQLRILASLPNIPGPRSISEPIEVYNQDENLLVKFAINQIIIIKVMNLDTNTLAFTDVYNPFSGNNQSVVLTGSWLEGEYKISFHNTLGEEMYYGAFGFYE